MVALSGGLVVVVVDSLVALGDDDEEEAGVTGDPGASDRRRAFS